MTRYWWFTGLLLSCGLLLSGCGGGSSVKVKGVVTLDGQPLDECFVGFIPDNPTGNGANCLTNEKGEFYYSSADSRDARNVLTPGPHTLTFSKLDKSSKQYKAFESQPGAIPNPNMPNLVPAQYRTKAQSPVKLTLKEGTNDAGKIEMTGASKGAKGK